MSTLSLNTKNDQLIRPTPLPVTRQPPYRPHTPGTRKERQRSVKVMSHCVHKVVKGVVDDVRPELRDGRYENRPSWSHGRTRASRARVEAVKVQRSPLKVAASQPQPCWPYLLLIQRLAGRRRRPQAARGGSSSPPRPVAPWRQHSNHLPKERICMHM